MRTCKKCGETKQLEEFRLNGGWRGHTCKVCHRAYQRTERVRKPLQYKHYSLKRIFGLTIAQYQRMWDAQQGCCAICKEAEKGKKLAVDHCHSTGQIRALLCGSCNNGLGRYMDDPVRLRRAAEYLEAHRGQETT